ncbi:MAG: endospore germination permease [Firmicutes bacterium]|nr:endospore germination permease [Bacillota bacterium]
MGTRKTKTQEKISNRQLLFIVFIIRATLIIATLPVLTTGHAAQNAWISSIITMIASIVVIIAISALSLKFPKMTIIEYSKVLLGKTGGTIMSLGFLWLFLHIAATDTRIYSEVLADGFLTSTPLVVTAGTIVAVSALAVYLGIEVIGRAADVLMPVIISFFVLSIVASLSLFDLKNLEPVFAGGITPVISGTVTPIGISVQFLSLGLLIPTLTEPEKAVSTSAVAAFLAGLALIVTSVIVVGALGERLSSSAIFPLFKTSRSTVFTRFLERLEAPGIAAWGLGLFIDVSTFLYCGSKGLSEVLGVEDYRPLVIPMAVIWITLSLHTYDDLFELLRLFRPETFFPYVSIVGFIPVLILWGAYIIKASSGKLHGLQKHK